MFSVRGGCYTALSYDVIHDVFVVFTFAKVEVISFDTLVSDQSLVLLHVLHITIRYDTRCYFNVRSKADISQLNLPHGTDNQKSAKTEKKI